MQAGLSKWTWLVGSPPVETCLVWGGCTPLRPEVVVCMVTGGLAGTTVETWYWRGLCLWDAFTPLILGAGRDSCLSWVCLCLCLSGSCVFVVFLSRLRGLAWSPLSQPLLSRRLLSCVLTSPVVLGVRFFGLRGSGSDAHASTVGLEGSALTMAVPGSFPPWFLSSCSPLIPGSALTPRLLSEVSQVPCISTTPLMQWWLQLGF